MQQKTVATTIKDWSVFFDVFTALLTETEAERQYGLANRNYTEYVLEGLKMTLSTCSYIKHSISHANELQEYVMIYAAVLNIFTNNSHCMTEDILDSGPMDNTSCSTMVASTTSGVEDLGSM